MSGAIYIGAAGAIRQQLNVETIANNLANIDTVGFKKDAAVFRIPPPDPEGGAPSSEPSASGRSALLAFGVYTDHGAGALKSTGNPLDVAIGGEGFFCIETPDGVQYTRKGNFHLNAENILVTSDGYPVLGENGTIAVEGDEISVDREGTITVDSDEAGMFRIVAFPQSGALEKGRDGLFILKDPNLPQERPEDVSVVQGSLETSNTDAIGELTRMIAAHRLFESYQKVIQTADDMDRKAVNELGSLA